ncbi:hypothetical protein GN157_10120 [Flavobacterium rakeshii]|uniref:DUF3857 domain-containing protein n=1 Tax=Flavobacterium rakeshii TaxID=1038845 RepID=A0A6N8HDX7_9FLAO|nr:hypothetical protein [Flavobacterium rakeshii]MUV04065.1 hypothetical protein [Flavobacterium rakeshii]
MKLHYTLYTLLLTTFISPVFSQSFITVDEDTYEFIADVNYSVFKNNKLVSKGVTVINEFNIIKTDFDSISFSRLDYETAGFKKRELDSLVFLKKSTIYLDEIVISNTKEDLTVIGEQNRFVKRQANSLSKELLYGLVFRNKWDTDITVTKADIFVNKVKHKTAYTIKFYTFQESFIMNGNQDIKNPEPVFTTDTLFLDPRTKGKVTIDIPQGFVLEAGENILVSVELVDYYDDEGNIITPEFKDLTKLKFQLSDRADYYAKLMNQNTHELTPNLRNINLLINYDFAHHFFKKPHKSSIVAPAILLYIVK